MIDIVIEFFVDIVFAFLGDFIEAVFPAHWIWRCALILVFLGVLFVVGVKALIVLGIAAALFLILLVIELGRKKA